MINFQLIKHVLALFEVLGQAMPTILIEISCCARLRLVVDAVLDFSVVTDDTALYFFAVVANTLQLRFLY